MSSERVFILGGTGNVGSKIVADLLSHNIPVTLFARSPEKVATLFTDKQELITVVQGDTSNIEPLKDALKGHTRLFLMLGDFKAFVHIKKTIAQYAYDNGVQQIVDLSSSTVNAGWRVSPIGAFHADAEKAILEIPNRGAFVALRPGRYMSNIFRQDPVITTGKIVDVIDPEKIIPWISPNDIAAVASVILRDDVSKHGDAVYSLFGHPVGNRERAEIMSRLVGKPVTYQRIPPLVRYKALLSFGFPHALSAYFSSNGDEGANSINYYIQILLEREPETLEQFLSANLDQIK
jgi:uncharacterized protein YbjT (DUF2867 family)